VDGEGLAAPLEDEQAAAVRRERMSRRPLLPVPAMVLNSRAAVTRDTRWSLPTKTVPFPSTATADVGMNRRSRAGTVVTVSYDPSRDPRTSRRSAHPVGIEQEQAGGHGRIEPP